MKKIRITSGNFKGQEFEIEDYLYLDDSGKLWNSNTHLSEALPGDMVDYEERNQVEIEGEKGTFIHWTSEMILEPTNFQMCLSRPVSGKEHGLIFPADDIYSSKVVYRRNNTAEYV